MEFSPFLLNCYNRIVKLEISFKKGSDQVEYNNGYFETLFFLHIAGRNLKVGFSMKEEGEIEVEAIQDDMTHPPHPVGHGNFLVNFLKNIHKKGDNDIVECVQELSQKENDDFKDTSSSDGHEDECSCDMIQSGGDDNSQEIEIDDKKDVTLRGKKWWEKEIEAYRHYAGIEDERISPLVNFIFSLCRHSPASDMDGRTFIIRQISPGKWCITLRQSGHDDLCLTPPGQTAEPRENKARVMLQAVVLANIGYSLDFFNIMKRKYPQLCEGLVTILKNEVNL